MRTRKYSLSDLPFIFGIRKIWMQNNYSLYPLTLYGVLGSYLCKYESLGVQPPTQKEETLKKIRQEAKESGNEVEKASGDVEKDEETENSVENEDNMEKETTSGMQLLNCRDYRYILS